MEINKWWQWVIAITLATIAIAAIVFVSYKVNDWLYDGDSRCIVVKCVIVK
jgi:formate-dependent nitrite reductase membrane component NrfD